MTDHDLATDPAEVMKSVRDTLDLMASTAVDLRGSAEAVQRAAVRYGAVEEQDAADRVTGAADAVLTGLRRIDRRNLDQLGEDFCALHAAIESLVGLSETPHRSG